ncbi:hypothetical protein [Yoonia sp. 2307UL14-13]|uniref:hypothetical protein n=1 Tax=Yoonia sp. 2307UL14-13 TaxID=3126506 RepID=UPI0030B46ED7
MIRFLLMWFLMAGVAVASPAQDVSDTARAAFDRLPPLRIVDRIAGRCGADDVPEGAAYCTTQNVIFLERAVAGAPQAPYLVAHLYGHAVQVRHGVADFALAQIRARRSEEDMLRGLVERQVDCIAGFLIARAGLAPMSLPDLFAGEPFTGSHWGRDPLRIGPQVSIGMTASEEWFQIGQRGDLAACGPGEFTADLLLAAMKVRE